MHSKSHSERGAPFICLSNAIRLFILKISKSCREIERVSILFYQQEMSNISFLNQKSKRYKKTGYRSLCLNNNNATIAETNAFYHVLFFKNRDCLFNSSKKWSGSILTKHTKKWLMIPWLEIPSLLQWGLITLCNAHHYRIQHISCIFVGGYLRHQDQVNLE